jgi:radical SAM/Cys-rich protein
MAALPHHPAHVGSDFEGRLVGVSPALRLAEGIRTVTVNVGLHCNLSCQLCYLPCSPNRTESMSRAIMLEVLEFASEIQPDLVDITGGEPTLWPYLREFVMLGRGTAERMRVHTNLDALLSPRQAGLPALLAEHRVEILASLPEALEGRTIGGCIEVLQHLTRLGYGDLRSDAKIALDIAYNPLPGELPEQQWLLERDFRQALRQHGITFGSLVATVNVDLGRFGDMLRQVDGTKLYREQLESHFDPAKLPDLPCRHGVDIAWDGTIWDCDYNLAANLRLAEGSTALNNYVNSPVSQQALGMRRIAFGEHCFACTAGQARPPAQGTP